MGKKKKKKARSPAPAAPAATSTNRLGVVVGILLLAGLTAAVVLVGKSTPPPAPAPTDVPPAPKGPSDLEQWQQASVREIAITADDPALGPADAPVTIVEFSDFQCPYCREAAQTLKRMKEQYGDRVRLVFKDFPLDTTCNSQIGQQVHPYACKAAVLAGWAGTQDRFWEMHDAIFALSELNDESLGRLPEAIGLDRKAFETREPGEGLAPIRADIDEGVKLGVTGTPTVFVNGRLAPNYQNLRPILEAALENP